MDRKDQKDNEDLEDRNKKIPNDEIINKMKEVMKIIKKSKVSGHNGTSVADNQKKDKN